jgi:hypothetical protein
MKEVFICLSIENKRSIMMEPKFVPEKVRRQIKLLLIYFSKHPPPSTCSKSNFCIPVHYGLFFIKFVGEI